MYEVIFEKNDGTKYLFGEKGDTVFDMDFGNGVSVDIGTSQGFSQVGETVESMSVGGRVISVKGCVFRNVYAKKTAMRNIFSPFAYGRLIFENKYYSNVYVKETPTFSPVKNDGRFTMQFFAPFPFFYFYDKMTILAGGVTPMFSFPVNYATPHTFGSRSPNKYSNIHNDGDVRVPFEIYIESFGETQNPRITNLKTMEYLQLNGTLTVGDSVNIYRDANNILRADLVSSGRTQDVLSWVDEGSTLFELNPGDNLMAYNDDLGGASLTVRFSYSPAVVAIYES